MTTSEQISEIAAALAKAQAQIQGAVKDSANPFFKSKYADLASVREACNGPLTANGIAVLQSPSAVQGWVSVETLLLHSSGQWIRGEIGCAPKDDGPQAVGSCITYLRRYALQSFAGVAPTDDDAEAAEGRGHAAVKPVAVPTPAGYDNWLLDMEAAADTGEAALTAAWKASKPEYRTHLPAAVKEKLKARAAKVPA